MAEINLENDEYELEISIGHSVYFRNKITKEDSYQKWDSLGVRSEYYKMMDGVISGWLKNISIDMLLPSPPLIKVLKPQVA